MSPPNPDLRTFFRKKVLKNLEKTLLTQFYLSFLKIPKKLFPEKGSLAGFGTASQLKKNHQQLFSGGLILQISLYLVAATLRLLFSTMSLILLISAIMSWLPLSGESKFEIIIYNLSETIVFPARCLFRRLGIGEDFIIDLPFLVTVIAIILIEMFLSIGAATLGF